MCRLVDYSEPVIWVMGVFGAISIVIGAIPVHIFVVTLASSLALLGCLSGWRVRRLGIAATLMDSVDDLREENNRLVQELATLKETTDALGETNRRFEKNNLRLENANEGLKGIIGLAGDTLGDMDKMSDRLIALYNKYHEENLRQEKNNMLQLFDVIDRDNDGILDASEVEKLRHYVKTAYNRDIDSFDGDNDGAIRLDEFVAHIV
jgi:hypothetical protein